VVPKKLELRDNGLMNQPNDLDNGPAEELSATPPVNQNQATSVQQAPVVPAAPVFDPRRRLRELLSIPESQRTDPQWDEIIELEVQLAPGNRIGQEGQGGHGGGGKRPQGQGHHPSGNKGGGGGGGGGNFKRHGAGRKFPKAKKPPQA
jgi:hypothetical protein